MLINILFQFIPSTIMSDADLRRQKTRSISFSLARSISLHPTRSGPQDQSPVDKTADSTQQTELQISQPRWSLVSSPHPWLREYRNSCSTAWLPSRNRGCFVVSEHRIAVNPTLACARGCRERRWLPDDISGREFLQLQR